MNWSSLAEFAAMGGYGYYVWGAFGMTALVMFGEMWSLRARQQALLASTLPADEEPHAGLDYREGAA